MTAQGGAPEARELQVAVIGCGVIGASWSALLSAYGYTVRAWDAADGWRERVSGALGAARTQLADLGAVGSGRVMLADSLQEAVQGADWVQESTSESLDVKKQVLAQITANANPRTIIASSTSSFTWSQLAPLVASPMRLVTAHPFNPPHLMPLVEVYAVDKLVGQRALEFFRSLKRNPILLRKDATGHIANRLASALWREAVHIVASGIAEVSDVDSAIVDGPGLRWSAVGPHMAYHLGGGAGGIRQYLKHLGDSQTRRWVDLGAPTLTEEVCEAIAAGVEREADGRSIHALSKERDETLIAALRAREARRRATS